ncbi:sigma-70 family RNA polymerase sigma factor [Bacillus sp. FJAT-29790]|uniref:sigma-70 family RNA polymerase sigma factor n=1 Tax=Bacillus sp. FJAT-29790 TaxID=1895002 RepID=UPI001C22D726|nr:sigma-70 family RNA polymerase sigma factor [Bacillus sp. FJAT-29790]MBU8881248.1 sigma-70 family RNA polymerase sigma factor [Bacillus sp. FJAT-29790]
MDTKMELDVIKAQKGDQEAFIRLIKAMESSFYRIASTIVKSDSDSLDAAQETIIKAYLSLHTLKEPRYFKTWIIKILIRECTHLLRVRNKFVPLVPDIHSHHYETSIEEKLDMRDCISKLENEYRIVISLFYLQDLSIKDIAEIIDQPEGTVKSRLSRARKKLEKWLTKDNESGGMGYERI